MPPPVTFDRCLMCGVREDSSDELTKLTDEHVISRTVRDQLPPVEGGVRRVMGDHVGAPYQKLYCVLKKAVCLNCNRGWMKELEDDLVSTLGAQIRDEGQKELNRFEAERVATWAAKTGLLLQVYNRVFGTGKGFAPEDNLRWLADKVSPPPGTEVWLGRFNPARLHLHESRPVGLYGEGGEPNSYITTFTIGCLVFVVCGSKLEIVAGWLGYGLSSLRPPQGFLDIVTKIWPAGEADPVWPCGRTLQPSEIDSFSTWPTQRFPAKPPEIEIE